MRVSLLLVFLVPLVFNSIQCNANTEKDWYETTALYQVYTRSFKDSNGDGIGDLNGIFEKLDYIKDIGIQTVWIQSFFKSPMVDFGFDVTDYKTVDPTYGSMDDLRRLVDAIHEKGMKVLFDFVPNHTSDESEWFKKSVNREDPYKDFYVWKDPKGYDADNRPIPPNNWLSVVGGSAWRWNERRKQFYYSVFFPGQPDLNYHNPKVRRSMEDVFQFWLDFGFDGFRVDAPEFIFEDDLMRDNPWVSPEVVNSTAFNSQIHTYQMDFEAVLPLLYEWRTLLDGYKERDNVTRIMAPETFAKPWRVVRYFGNSTHEISHFPFYFGLFGLKDTANATDLERIIHSYMDIMPPNGVPSWVSDTHDLHRLPSRYDPEFSEAAFMIQLLLPGVASVYYGQEIGMKDTKLRPDQKREIKIDNRGACRGPMQWDDSINAGFTTKKNAWLPVSSDFWRINVKKQLEDPRSPLNTFKRLMNLRSSPVIQYGEWETCVVSEWIHMISRKLRGHPSIFVLVNMGSETESVCLNNCAHHQNVSGSMEVHTASANSGYNTGDRVIVLGADSDCFSLRPKAGVVLTTAHISSTGFSTISSTLVSFTILLLKFMLLDCQFGLNIH
nr:PREDICTED: alpha-glucosidase-like [Bemisia tabaci]